jgi:hypothetical protein
MMSIYPYNPEKIPEEAFSIADAVLSASANDNNGTDKCKSSDCVSRSGTESSASSLSLAAGNQSRAGSSLRT